MKVLFRQKQWILIQVIFAIVGIWMGVIVKAQSTGPSGGLAVGLHFINATDEYTLPILLILLSDLAFTVEYVQGTFLTSLTGGKSRRSWMLKKSATFYVFVLLQYILAFVLLSLAAGTVTGHIGLEGLKASNATSYNVIAREMGMKVLQTLVFVSFGVFVTTLLPGKLVIGSIASMGIILLGGRFETYLYYVFHQNTVVGRLLYIVWMQDPNTAWSWVFGCTAFALLVWASAERVQRIEVPSRGV